MQATLAAALPPDVREMYEQLEACGARAERITAGLTEAQFHWRADPAKWGIAECLEHLATANRVYSAPIRAAIDEARARGWTRRGDARSSFFGRQFIASLEPPAKMKTKAPKKIRPAVPGTLAEVMRGYAATHDLVRQLILDAANVDLNRAVFQNPFLPLVRMRAGTGLRIILAHERRHLWQAEQVRAQSGFPLA